MPSRGNQESMNHRRFPCVVAVLSLGCSVWFGWWATGQEPTTDSVAGKLGDVIRLGEAIVEQTTTHPLSQAYVGNSLNCTSCHLENGRHATAGTLIGTATAYPAWSPREGSVITLEDRVLNCFMRSCHGIRPPLGSEVSVAITTYITSLSQGQSMRMNAQRPLGPNAVPKLALSATQANAQRGREIYDARCADCHGHDGQGDTDNPPVWGERSFNDGAGLAAVDKLAAWLKVAMPLDDATMTEQESLDVAAYVNSHGRPHFILADHLPINSELGEYNSRVAD